MGSAAWHVGMMETSSAQPADPRSGGPGRRCYWRPAAWLWGILAGTAVQLQQASLGLGWHYAASALLGVVASLLLSRWRRPLPWPDRALCCLAAAALAFGLAGMRAVHQAHAVAAAIRGCGPAAGGCHRGDALPVSGGQRWLKTEQAWLRGRR